MAAKICTVAFEGAQARLVDVQVQVTGGPVGLFVVGLPDKAVAESRERVRAALAALGLSLPGKRMIVSLSPADLPKEGAHYDLPIALAILAALDVVPRNAFQGYVAIGELALDAGIASVNGALPAAMAAGGAGLGLICPAVCGAEAAWAGSTDIVAAGSLMAVLNHIKGLTTVAAPEPGALTAAKNGGDLRDVRGQDYAKRALEIAAAGGHNLLMVGPPGSGKSMLAARLPGLLPPLSAREVLDVSTIQSVAGLLSGGQLTRTRPFRAPHHSASMPALVGGGKRATPGEISLAHHGVLFLDELPEFHPQALESLRQPLETGRVCVARAARHVSYPAQFQLVAAMNPCRCGGHAGGDGVSCRGGPKCGAAYRGRISGPLMDRIDIQIALPAVNVKDLALPPSAEGTQEVAARVARARKVQARRHGGDDSGGGVLNARLTPGQLDQLVVLDGPARGMVSRAAEVMGLTARGYHRVLRVARTIADLDGADFVGTRVVGRAHVAEALALRANAWRGGVAVSGGAVAA